MIMKNFLKKFAVTLCLWPFFSATLTAEEIWRAARRPLSDLVELRDERETLPESRWLGRDQRRVNRDMDRIKNRLLQVLERSELTKHRDAHHAAVAEQEAWRARLRELRELQLSAPEERSPHQVFTKTKQDYARDIEKAVEAIRALDREREARVNEMREEYARMGIDLNVDQIQFYLSSVSGDEIMGMSALFHHTRDINRQLEALIRANPEDIDSARRYYGVHVVLLETMQHAHAKMVERIDQKYIGALSDLEQENEALIQRTEELLSGSTSRERDVLLRNRQLQDLTARTLTAYRQHLDQVRTRVAERLSQLNRCHEIAANSYATLRVSSALASQIEQLIRDLNTLQDMHLPELLPFENQLFEEKFRAITRELEGAR
ncbi:MAG: hypothetical protein JJU05_17175 [Verrucomicrobia bacterium]|nr:hypothetical protein [Verrucomicrobiota bacterium]MCH8527177.1 hypothetical protein [Kiritimatiellia bacterium]